MKTRTHSLGLVLLALFLGMAATVVSWKTAMYSVHTAALLPWDKMRYLDVVMPLVIPMLCVPVIVWRYTKGRHSREPFGGL
jgi:mannose/fructose/N-acetylgalactosamine-specific phosphotransferase system component IID